MNRGLMAASTQWEQVLRFFFHLAGISIHFLGNLAGIYVNKGSGFGQKFKLIAPIGAPARLSIFCQELESYGRESFGEDVFEIITIDRSKNLSNQIFKYWPSQVRGGKASLFLDLRTFSNSWFHGFFQALQVKLIATTRGVDIYSYVTDISIIRNRLLAIILTAKQGVIVSLLNQSYFANKIPHCRIYSPVLMPISIERVIRQGQLSINNTVSLDNTCLLSNFVGSLYPERNNILQLLSKHKELIELSILDKSIGLRNEEYWQLLATSQVSIITTAQTNVENNWVDLNNKHHVVWRISEALAAKSVALIQDVQGLEGILENGRDYLNFTSEDDLISALDFLVRNPFEMQKIAESGHQTFLRLQRDGHFWGFLNRRLL
jgi:hypothetical protein